MNSDQNKEKKNHDSYAKTIPITLFSLQLRLLLEATSIFCHEIPFLALISRVRKKQWGISYKVNKMVTYIYFHVAINSSSKKKIIQLYHIII